MATRKFSIPQSRAGRSSRLGALASKLTGRFALTNLRSVGADDERRAELLDLFHLKSAEQVVRSMAHMKGAVMKLGQMVSFVSDDVPPAYQRILAQLQTTSDPMDFPLVRRVLEEDLGAPIEELFAELEEEPVASASIGQVHRGRLPDGAVVAVKVQYPGVDEAIRADLDNLSWVKPLMRLLHPGLSAEPLIGELKARMFEELDYVNEARNQRHFAELYAGHPQIHVPAPYPDHCGKRVLTTEWVDGHGFAWLLDQPEEFRRDVAEVLFRFVFGSIAHHALNGDPHPGNYLFHEDGRVTFLDFGCVKYFEAEFMAEWMQLIDAHQAGNRQLFRQLAESIGFLPAGVEADVDDVFSFGVYYEPFREDREFAFTPEYTSGTLTAAFSRASPHAELLKQVDMPSHFVFVNRIQWGLYAILTKLSARENFYRVFREYTHGEAPATEIGRSVRAYREAWFAERGLPVDSHVWLDAEGMHMMAGSSVASTADMPATVAKRRWSLNQ